VWRALCDPAEVVRWDSGVAAALDAPADYPKPGQHVRWRYRSGRFRVLHDRPQEVDPERRLRSLLALGPFRYDETYEIEPASEGCRLTARLRTWTALPVVGPLVDRLYLGPSTKAAFESSLASIKRFCEAVGPTRDRDGLS
jgi:hypothetical protein